MGDLSAEPSMEEILSSIKRIIAEEGETPGRARRSSRSAVPNPATLAAAVDEVLELSDPMPATPMAAELSRRAQAHAAGHPIGDEPWSPPMAIRRDPEPEYHDEPAAEPIAPVRAAAPESPVKASPPPAPEPSIVSRETADASRGALDSLSRMMVKPDPANDGTLEGLVREMLRPMLREWLDASLPAIVESMVAREIARITRDRS